MKFPSALVSSESHELAVEIGPIIVTLTKGHRGQGLVVTLLMEELPERTGVDMDFLMFGQESTKWPACRGGSI